MSLRDRLGRFLARRPPREAQPEPAPELGPAARQAIAWLAGQPDSRRLLAGLDQPEPPREPAAGRRDPAPDDPSNNPLAELVEKAAALTARVDRLAIHDERWTELSRAGYTEEALGQIAQYGTRRGIADPRQAAAALERETGYPEMASGSPGRNRYLGASDERARQQADAAAYQALMDGDDDTWLGYAIPATLASMRGQ